MQSNKESNQKLIERFPFLIPRNRWTGKVPEDYDYRMLLRESSLYATTSPFTHRRGTTASAATSAGRAPPAPS